MGEYDFLQYSCRSGHCQGNGHRGPFEGCGRLLQREGAGAGSQRSLCGPVAASLRLLVQIAKGKAERVFRGSLARRGSEGDVGEEPDKGDD